MFDNDNFHLIGFTWHCSRLTFSFLWQWVLRLLSHFRNGQCHTVPQQDHGCDSIVLVVRIMNGKGKQPTVISYFLINEMKKVNCECTAVCHSTERDVVLLPITNDNYKETSFRSYVNRVLYANSQLESSLSIYRHTYFWIPDFIQGCDKVKFQLICYGIFIDLSCYSALQKKKTVKFRTKQSTTLK